MIWIMSQNKQMIRLFSYDKFTVPVWVCPQSPDNSEARISRLTIQKIKMAGKVELYTTDFALDASGASYKGLIVVNKVH